MEDYIIYTETALEIGINLDEAWMVQLVGYTGTDACNLSVQDYPP